VNGNALDFTDGVITFNCNAITVGRADREWSQMLMLIRLGHCNLDAEVFNLCLIKWSQLCHVWVYKWHNVMLVCFARGS
jgi:hypothetical protein